MRWAPASAVDYLILAALAIMALRGWRDGLLGILAGIAAMAAAAVIALREHGALAAYVDQRFDVPGLGAGLITFLVTALLLSVLFTFVLNTFVRLLPRGLRGSRFNRASGAILGGGKGLVYAAAVLLVLAGLPGMQSVKDAIAASHYGPPILQEARVVVAETQELLQTRYWSLLRDSLALVTQQSMEQGTRLPFRTRALEVDPAAEEEMLRLINQERAGEGLKPLVMDATLRVVARAHAADMLRRGYFAHETPEGTSAADRLNRQGVPFVVMGENLALAPNVAIAHRGLMGSPGHRENILGRQFGRIGIGAVRGAIYGIMFAQEFTN